MTKANRVATGAVSILVATVLAMGLGGCGASAADSAAKGEGSAAGNASTAASGVEDAANGEGAGAASASGSSANTPGTASGPFAKTEVVYANLSSDGAVEGVYVVNRFDMEEPVAIRDFGAYESVANLTDQQALSANDANDAVVFESDEGVFFYQGNLGKAQLPWDVQVTYSLDGRPMDPRLMVGMSGQVEVRLTTTRNSQVNPAFADSFMQQITFTLPSDQWSNVKAEGATIASAGRDQTVAFTVLPGKDGDVRLSATVKDFSMGEVSIAALPYASVIEMPDVGDIEGEMSTLSDAIAALDEGAAELASGADELASGARELQGGTDQLASGLVRVGKSSDALVQASGQIGDALSALADGLANADFSALGQLGQLADQLEALAGGLERLSAASGQVSDGLKAALGAMDAAAASAPSDLTQEEITALLASPNLTDAERVTAQKLAQAWAALQTMNGTYAQVRPAFEGALALAESLGAGADAEGSLASMAAGLKQAAAAVREGADPSAAESLQTLVGGVNQLAEQYGQFHKGLTAYSEGVSALADGAAQLVQGTNQLAEGTGTYASGSGEFSNGMGQLAQETATLPRQMRERMDSLMADYEFPEFQPVSFVDERNASVQAVQFVMTLAAVEAPEEPEAAAEEELQPTIWDRFLDLFR